MEMDIITGSWTQLEPGQKQALLKLPLSDRVVTIAALGVNQYIAKAAIRDDKDLTICCAGSMDELPVSLIKLCTKFNNAGATIIEYPSDYSFGYRWRNTITHLLAWVVAQDSTSLVKIIGTPQEWANERAGYFHVLRQAQVLGITVERYKLANGAMLKMKPWVPHPKYNKDSISLDELINGDSVSLSMLRELVHQEQNDSKLIYTTMRNHSSMLEVYEHGDIVWYQPSSFVHKLQNAI